jgi:hypothetical protein
LVGSSLQEQQEEQNTIEKEATLRKVNRQRITASEHRWYETRQHNRKQGITEWMIGSLGKPTIAEWQLAPTVQFVQTLRPVPTANCPFGQAEHAAMPVADLKKPRAQAAIRRGSSELAPH